MVAPTIHVAVIEGLATVDATLSEMARAYRFTPAMRLWHVYAPAMAAPLFSGGVVALGMAMRVAVLAEALGAGEILAVLGPSGIGKSTLLRLAARLSRPTSGTVMLAVRRIGFVFQEPRLLPWRTALENVALPLLAMGVPLEQARTRAAAMLGRMGLAAFATSCPETLSGGMRQRVSLARAFVVEPELLLLDEPFTGLDPELRLSMRRHLDALLAASGAASLHVTHDIGDIPVRTNRILRLTAAGVRFERPCDLGMTVLKEAL